MAITTEIKKNILNDLYDSAFQIITPFSANIIKFQLHEALASKIEGYHTKSTSILGGSYDPETMIIEISGGSEKDKEKLKLKVEKIISKYDSDFKSKIEAEKIEEEVISEKKEVILEEKESSIPKEIVSEEEQSVIDALPSLTAEDFIRVKLRIKEGAIIIDGLGFVELLEGDTLVKGFKLMSGWTKATGNISTDDAKIIGRPSIENGKMTLNPNLEGKLLWAIKGILRQAEAIQKEMVK